MPSIKDLKKRIGSVKNTQQTTRAMKMVSAAKLRRAQDGIQNHRPYARKIGELIQLLQSLQTETVTSPLFRTREQSRADASNLSTGEAAQGRRVLLVLFTSDRGLCGGFNSNVIKNAQRWLAAKQASYADVQLAFVGRKGYDFFKLRQANLGPYFSEINGKVTFAKGRQLAEALVTLFLDGKYDEIRFVYNEFVNAITQVVKNDTFLPLVEPAVSEKEAQEGAELPNYIVKPDAKILLEQLIAKNFAIQAFRVLLESQAGEHGARMSAMENATKNAGEMIRKLTLQYNKQRQAGITKELLEIIAGSESQKGC